MTSNTSLDSTLSQNEEDLYRLLERANLLQYFTNFLAKGGDDLSQLSDSTKEEFDEIIDLIGMKQKPLHIRRLQKSLKDWQSDPEVLKESNLAINVPSSALTFLKINQAIIEPCASTVHKQNIRNKLPSESNLFTENDHQNDYTTNSSSSNSVNSNLPPLFGSPQSMFSTNLFNNASRINNSSNIRGMDLLNTPGLLGNTGGIPVSMLPNAVLSNAEKNRIRIAAANLAHTLPHIDARVNYTGRKDVNKGVMNVLSMAKDDPHRIHEIYKYSAIYGRFNAPRRTGKPMNHHEVSVNEAAAQLCIQIPQLITRRDNLFHLARQVVKMAEEIPPANIQQIANSSLPSQIHSSASGFTSSSYLNSIPKTEPTVFSNEDHEEFESQISRVKSEIEGLLNQECRIRESYREAKQSNQGLLMNELQKRLDDTLNQLNNKFTEQTSLATKRMMLIDTNQIIDSSIDPSSVSSNRDNKTNISNLSHTNDNSNIHSSNGYLDEALLRFDSNTNNNCSGGGNTFLNNADLSPLATPEASDSMDILDSNGSHGNMLLSNHHIQERNHSNRSGTSLNSSEDADDVCSPSIDYDYTNTQQHHSTIRNQNHAFP